MKVNCNFCGYEHEKKQREMSCLGKVFDSCKNRNHFKCKCKKVHTVSQLQIGNDDYDDQWLMVLNHKEESIVLV